jgi:predicted  nucleic acid-binding Zn-ribbon protein
MTPEEKYLEENASPSPDRIDLQKLEDKVSDLHPKVEQRFQKIEEELEGIKNHVLPFLERSNQTVQELRDKLEALRLKMDPAATPEFTEEDVTVHYGKPPLPDVLTIPGNSESVPKGE